MLTPDRGALRAVRSGVLAVFVLGLSAGAHALGGGRLPGVDALAVIGVVAALSCVIVTRWRLPTAAVAALLAASQLALHEVFMVTAPSTVHRMTSGASPMATSGHHAATSLWLGGPSSSDAVMLLAHTAAAVALALLYSRGDDAVWALCAWLAPLVGLLVACSPVVPARLRAALPQTLLPMPRRDLLRSVQRRGPPRLLAG